MHWLKRQQNMKYPLMKCAGEKRQHEMTLYGGWYDSIKICPSDLSFEMKALKFF